jgi:WD40 repeat protein
VQVFAEHSLPVSAVAVSPDGKLVASAAGRTVADAPDEGEIFLWEASTGRVVHQLLGHRKRPVALAFSPDGLRLASAGGDREIKLWDVASGQEVLALRGHQDDVTSLSFSADGRLLASGSMDRTMRIWSGAASEADRATLSGERSR